MPNIKLGLLGANGKMGNTVQRLLKDDGSNISLFAQADLGDPLEPLLTSDVIIDFSSPTATLELIRKCLNLKPQKLPALVVGSTGWKIDDLKELESLSKKTIVFISSNFSLGVMVFLEILKFAQPILKKLKYTPVIIEKHHQHKKDAPSGTAVSIRKIVSSPESDAFCNIQTHSVRAGDIVGDHEVGFYGLYDQLIFTHQAKDRAIFGRGALEIALWLAEKRVLMPSLTGLFEMGHFFKEKLK
ncbi:MAG: 4-hydroxy-tetrahydrodipicolinate reductase [Deltaproteobacteria bacterium]|nr:4-hydroxy-tetrahydrodipicolinate reductase [Deltaproteobacteria bacterium]